MTKLVDLTIIIPTHNRSKSLQRLFASLHNANGLSDSDVEVLVVDNGSTDQTRAEIETELNRPNWYQLSSLEEPRRGKAFALNCGLRVAQGRVIMVLDDDVTIEPWALKKHLMCYEESPFDAVQGRILPGVDPAGKPGQIERIREYNIPLIDYGEIMRPIRGLTGTNMSFKREIFETIGGFDTRLGPGAAGFSEDTEFSLRIRGAGFAIGYTPDAVVYHELDPNRYGRRYNRMVEFRKGLSRSIYRHDSIPFNVLPYLCANCVRYGLYRALGNRLKAYKTEGRVMKSWGYLSGKAKAFFSGAI